MDNIFQDQQQTESKHEIRITPYKNAVALGNHLYAKAIELMRMPKTASMAKMWFDKDSGQLVFEIDKG